jgi:filamentous hemagglutinin family protein
LIFIPRVLDSLNKWLHSLALLKCASSSYQIGREIFRHFKTVIVSATVFVISVSHAAGPNLQNSNVLPTGGSVAAGQAVIATSGNTMNINQSSQRAVVNWNSFNVGKNATVNFNQPNVNSSTLNRVNSPTKSMINGAINANGEVVFVNANGITFGRGAEINAGGITATTMDIKDSDYMNGNLSYSGNGSGKIVNKGNITVNSMNGYIALMAPEVRNEGVLTATLSGNNAVALISGQKVTLTVNGGQLSSYSVDASAIKSLITNKRLIQVNGGQVIIAANAISDLKASVINNTGVISADGLQVSGGKIILTAGVVNQGGVISANSDTKDGGQIVLAGNEINVNPNSTTTAIGTATGGQILVGKTNINTAQSAINANTVNISKGAVLDVSSSKNGDGGSVQIWSQTSSNVSGVLRANGGSGAGNGGIIDTSSAGKVSYGQGLFVDTLAKKGKIGNWTTDPLTITIDLAAASILSQALSTTNITLDATAFGCGSIGTCAQSANASINFLAGADVYSSNPLTSLILNAPGGTINVNSNVTAGAVYAMAQTININGSINTNGGSNSLIYLAGAIINILGNINSNGNTSNNTGSSNLNFVNTTTGTNRRNSQNGLIADTNIYSTNGGVINIIATSDIHVGGNSYISSNGVNGGVINIISTAGTTIVNGIIDSIGQRMNGGNIAIAGKTQTDIIGALISSEGLSQGGVINLGHVNNLSNGTILAPPATAPRAPAFSTSPMLPPCAAVTAALIAAVFAACVAAAPQLMP